MYRIETKKDIKKLIRTIFEGIFLLVLLFFIIKALFVIKIYEPYDETDTQVVSGEDKGFLALSYFGVDRSGTDTLISTERLGEHLEALSELGYVTVTQQDILDYYEKGKPLPDKALFLMFEDGRKDTAIFAQKVLEKNNFIATALTYAEKFETKDNKFLMPRDLNSLMKGGWWELGTNGYRLSYINAYDRYGRFLGELTSREYIELTDYMGRDYNHYLMDYIRDKDGLPVESQQMMRERITHDYDLMNDIYTEEIGELPDFYVLMHANTGMFGNNEAVSEVNEENITRLFAANFNREGFSMNNRESSVYDLTRMQPQAYWYTNHLLMRIKYDLAEEERDTITFVTGDEERMQDWELLSGAAEFKGEQIVLTSEPESEGTLRLKGSDSWSDVRVTAQLTGNKVGTQTIYLRADEEKSRYVAVKIQNDVLYILQNTGAGEEELFSMELRLLDDTEPVSVEEDSQAALESELSVRARYSGSIGEWLAYIRERRQVQGEKVQSVDEGAEEYIKEIQILAPGDRNIDIFLQGSMLSVQIDGKDAATDIAVGVDEAGSLYLESCWGGDGYSQRNLADDVYDAVFEQLSVYSADDSSQVLYRNVLTGTEKVAQTVSSIWNTIVDWFVRNL